MTIMTMPLDPATKLIDLAAWAARHGKRLRYVPEAKMRSVQKNLTRFVDAA